MDFSISVKYAPRNHRVEIHRDSLSSVSIEPCASNAARILDEWDEDETRQIVSASLYCRMLHSEWSDPDGAIIAAVLDAEDVARLAPDNTYDPRWPGINGVHLGRIPETVPLRLANRPKGWVAGAGDETVMRPGFARFLQTRGSGTLGKVEFTNPGSMDWVRYFPASDCSVLAAENLSLPMSCYCGLPLVRTWGYDAHLGRRHDELTVARDIQGESHLGLTRPYIVSVEIARELKEQFGSFRDDDLPGDGFTLSPVIDMNSPVGEQVSEFLERLRSIWNRHREKAGALP